MTILHQKIGEQHILYHHRFQSRKNFSKTIASCFDPEQLANFNQVYATAQGRGTSYFFRPNALPDKKRDDWVLRHYYRGGLMGKINHDTFLWQPIRQTRAYRELALLEHLEQLKLPAPRPVAGRVSYRGCCYCADIITTTLKDCQTLTDYLVEEQGLHKKNNTRKKTAFPIWKALGKLLARFHRHHIFHADLNANNILINAQHDIYLIDFDKGKVMPDSGGKAWQQNNLQRLLRSLHKEQDNNSTIQFNVDHDWHELIEAYGQPSS